MKDYNSEIRRLINKKCSKLEPERFYVWLNALVAVSSVALKEYLQNVKLPHDPDAQDFIDLIEQFGKNYYNLIQTKFYAGIKIKEEN